MRAAAQTYAAHVTVDAVADYQPPLTRWGHTWRLALVVLISLGAFAGSFEGDRDRGAALIVLDIVLGVVAFGLVLLRRKHPFPIAVVISLLTVVSAAAAGPAALAVTSLATRRVRWQTGVGSGHQRRCGAHLLRSSHPATGAGSGISSPRSSSSPPCSAGGSSSARDAS